MKKYSRNNKKPLKKANNKQKRPNKTPLLLRIVPIIFFIFCFLIKYPNITAEVMKNIIIESLLMYAFIAIVWHIYYRHRLAGATIEKIDRMTGEEFEEYLAILYRKHGFEVKMTPKTCDFGADLLLKDKKSGKKICVQAKRYRGLVGEAAVQQTLSGREYYSCDAAMIITNSHYTDAAKSLARKCGIKMIDRFKLGKEDMYLF